MKHWHVEVLTDHGFSLSTRHWLTEDDARMMATRIANSRICWTLEHHHPMELHIPRNRKAV